MTLKNSLYFQFPYNYLSHIHHGARDLALASAHSTHLYLFPVPFGECLNNGTATTCQALLLLLYQQGQGPHHRLSHFDLESASWDHFYYHLTEVGFPSSRAWDEDS